MVLTTFRLQKPGMGDFVHSHSASKDWRLWAQVGGDCTAGQRWSGISVAVGGTSWRSHFLPSPLDRCAVLAWDLVCPGTDAGRTVKLPNTSHLLGSGPPDSGAPKLTKLTRFLYPASFRAYAVFVFVLLTCSVL